MSGRLISNRLTIKNTGNGFDELVKLFTKTSEMDPTPFNSLVPMPREIYDVEALTIDRQDANWFVHRPRVYDKANRGEFRNISSEEMAEYFPMNAVKEEFFKKYGVSNWHQWSIKNWGTPWDAFDIEISTLSEDEVLIKFNTINNSPMKIFG